MDSRIYLECFCGDEVMQVTHSSNPDSPKDSVFGFTIFERKNSQGTKLKFRLKLFWTMLTTGSPYLDNIVVSSDQLVDLIKFYDINKILGD